MKDININFTDAAGPSMTMDWGDGTVTAIFLSLWIRKGSFFFDLELGSMLHTIKKVTDSNVDLAARYARDALAWMVSLGRISDLQTSAARSSDGRGISVSVFAKRPDGSDVSFSLWTEVL